MNNQSKSARKFVMIMLLLMLFSLCAGIVVIMLQPQTKQGSASSLQQAEKLASRFHQEWDLFVEEQRKGNFKAAGERAVKVAALGQLLRCQLIWLTEDEKKQFMQSKRCMSGCNYGNNIAFYEMHLQTQVEIFEKLGLENPTVPQLMDRTAAIKQAIEQFKTEQYGCYENRKR